MIMNNKKYLRGDISDSPEDQEKLKGDQAILELPELKDIPGVSHPGINPLFTPGNTTSSSADEEGDELLDEHDDSPDTNVTALEKKLLNEPFEPSYDRDLPIQSLTLDDRDEDGELLEETGQENDLFGKDLDDKLIEEEDEESGMEGQQ
jgi:hypothetical protein